MLDVQVTLDRPRALRYSINAIAELERVLGQPIGEIVGAMRALSIMTIRAMVWAGLRHENSRLTLDGAGLLIDTYLAGGGTLGDLYGRLDAALVASGTFGRAPDGGAEGNAPIASPSG